MLPLPTRSSQANLTFAQTEAQTRNSRATPSTQITKDSCFSASAISASNVHSSQAGTTQRTGRSWRYGNPYQQEQATTSAAETQVTVATLKKSWKIVEFFKWICCCFFGKDTGAVEDEGADHNAASQRNAAPSSPPSRTESMSSSQSSTFSSNSDDGEDSPQNRSIEAQNTDLLRSNNARIRSWESKVDAMSKQARNSYQTVRDSNQQIVKLRNDKSSRMNRIKGYFKGG